MDAARAVWKDGQVVLDGPVDWPDGSKLLIEPAAGPGEAIGVCDDDWSNAPEAVARWLRWYESLEPLIFTPEEEAGFAAWRQERKKYAAARSNQHLDGLFE